MPNFKTQMMCQATRVHDTFPSLYLRVHGRLRRVASIVMISVLFISSGYAQSPVGLPEKAWLLPSVWEESNNAEVQQSNYYDFMWRSFIALNWPNVAIKVVNGKIVEGFRGQPDENVSILDQKGNGPLKYFSVWETYRQPSEIFLTPDKWANYPDWNTPPANQAPAQAANARRLLSDYNRFVEYATDLNQPDFFPNPTGPLIDQNRNYVRYEVAVNQAFFTYIKYFGYYNTNEQIRAVQRSIRNPNDKRGFEPAPFGTTEEFAGGYLKDLEPFARQGMVDVKAAWRVLDTAKGDRPERYLHRMIYTQEGKPPQLMGLVALHILRFTPNLTPDGKQAGRVAATFEQVDNVCVDYDPLPGLNPSFNTGDNPSDIQKRLGFEGAIPAPIPKGATPPRNPEPVSIYRVTHLPAGVQMANAKYQNMLKPSVFQYYRLIGTQNKRPGNPPDISFAPKDRDKNGHQGPLTGVYTNTNNLINTALESYTQTNHSCIQCHVRARPLGVPTQAREVDHFKTLTFLLQNAHSTFTLSTNEYLGVREYIVSPNNLYFAIMQSDGNLCVYKGKPQGRLQGSATRVWCSGRTASGGEFYAIMQEDGNLCVYSGTGPKNRGAGVWCSESTAAGGQFFAAIQDDGKFCVYKGTPQKPGERVWCNPQDEATHTDLATHGPASQVQTLK